MKKNAPVALMLISISFGYAFNGLMHSISSAVIWKIIASLISVAIFLFLLVMVLLSMRKK